MPPEKANWVVHYPAEIAHSRWGPTSRGRRAAKSPDATPPLRLPNLQSHPDNKNDPESAPHKAPEVDQIHASDLAHAAKQIATERPRFPWLRKLSPALSVPPAKIRDQRSPRARSSLLHAGRRSPYWRRHSASPALPIPDPQARCQTRNTLGPHWDPAR